MPRISSGPCSVCGTAARSVAISPPGDPFPAMEGHIQAAVEAIDKQFGSGVGRSLLPSDKTIVMNKIPSLDAMYEIVVDGYIVGRLRFDVPRMQYTFLLSLEGARRLGTVSKQKWVSCHDEVLRFLKDGASLLVPGIAGCDMDIELGDEVWVTNSLGQVVAVGIARMTGREIAKASRGLAVKIREFSEPAGERTNEKAASWDDAVLANGKDLSSIETRALGFIRSVIQQRALPVVVGFSGGKDSLVTYLLVEKAIGRSPPMFFMNTGLELPETVEYVEAFAARHGADLITRNMGDHFWAAVSSFGPPARDFRWCCKVLKLGPAATSIVETLGGETLAFMGQRKLESFQRSIEPKVSMNTWVPGQISANAIQDWNALEVWLFIFQSGEPFNPLYSKGYHRMGCYLCPASPISELRSIEKSHPQLYTRWMSLLEQWARDHGLPKEWAEFGFWRWKTLPKGQIELMTDLGLEMAVTRVSPAQALELNIAKGVSPCKASGFSIEGQFSSGIDLSRVGRLLPIFGPVRESEELGAIRVKAGMNSVLLFSSGSLVVRGPDAESVERITPQLERAVRRAVFCQACGSCVPKCKNEALSIDEGRISVDPDRCTNCLECDSWPCPTYLS